MGSKSAQNNIRLDKNTIEKNLIIDPEDFHSAISKLRGFFVAKGFIEVHTQNRLSILAACEDPETVQVYQYMGQLWPLPQTGQMWLEHELLKNKQAVGFFCVSTSYRNEPNPVAGRHDLIFPMFEFEMKGDFEALIALECELLEHLGYGKAETFPRIRYETWAKKCEVKLLGHEHEAAVCEEKGPVVLITHFPERTHPFWNTKRDVETKVSFKCDIILDGQETIGSSERSCDLRRMRFDFYMIENGKYSELLYDYFGKDRVDKEFNDFMKYDFITRSGGGIGVTRLIRSMKKHQLL